MATEWLPEGFENRDASAPGRMAQRVRTRVAVHRRRARMVRTASLSALSVVALLGLAHLLPRLLPGKKAPSAPAPVQTARLQTPPGWTPEGDRAHGSASPSGVRELAPAGPSGVRELAPAGPSGVRELAPASPSGVRELAPAGPSGVRELAPAGKTAAAGLPHSIPNSQYAIRNSQSPIAVSLEKAGQNVELAWKGNPHEEYVVYRCTSPRFDQCGVAGIVRGSTWVDRGKETAPVVFYRVEPKSVS